MNYDIKKSGDRIYQLRIQHKYTQEEFAKALNIDRSSLSRIETGKRGCSLDLLIQLSSLFNVSLDHLILGQERSDSVERKNNLQLKAYIEQLIEQLDAFKAKL